MRLELRHEGLQRVRQLLDLVSDTDLASVLDINHSTLYRVLCGQCRPGERFIAGALAAFGRDHFYEIFAVLPDDEEAVS